MENKTKIVKFIPVGLKHKYGDEDKLASLVWSIRQGYPRMTIYLDNSESGGKLDYSKVIIAPLDSITLETYLGLLEKVIGSDNNTEYKINCYNIRWDNGVKTNDIYLQASLVVGKDEEGVIYIGSTVEGKPFVKFPLTVNTRWHRIIGKNGAELTDKAELSKLHAKSYLKLLSKLFDTELKELVNTVYLDKPGNRSAGSAYVKTETVKTENKVASTPSVDAAVDDLFPA